MDHLCLLPSCTPILPGSRGSRKALVVQLFVVWRDSVRNLRKRTPQTLLPMLLPRTCSLAFLILCATFSVCWPSHPSSRWNSEHLEFVAGNRLPSSLPVSASLLALQHAEPSQLSEPSLHRQPARFLLLAHVAARDCGCAYPLLVPVPSSSGRRA